MTSSNTSILDEIAALEDARYTAMLKGDVATLERLLHPVLVYWPKADMPSCTAHVRFQG